MWQLCLVWPLPPLTSIAGLFGPCIGLRKAQCSGRSLSLDTTGASLPPSLSLFLFVQACSLVATFFFWSIILADLLHIWEFRLSASISESVATPEPFSRRNLSPWQFFSLSRVFLSPHKFWNKASCLQFGRTLWLRPTLCKEFLHKDYWRGLRSELYWNEAGMAAKSFWFPACTWGCTVAMGASPITRTWIILSAT